MSTNWKYDAFISYRHCMPDRLVAERLQKKLEDYKFPKTLAGKTGQRGLRRVFRDESEFTVSDDLSEAITEALGNSEYLIVICSPSYLTSPWCMKEVETFLKIRDRKHILPVLADGDERNAFPEILCYEEVLSKDENGEEVAVKQFKEPLAADCRGTDDKERKANIDTAVLKLIAAMFGLNYDDLKQRHKEERIKRQRRFAGIIFLAVLLVAIQSTFFVIKISMQNREIEEKYSDTLAATSARLLQDGRRLDAVYAARSVLPDKKMKEFSAEACRALVTATGVYSMPGEFVSNQIFTIPATIVGMKESFDGRYLAILGANSVNYIIDTDSGEMIHELPDTSRIATFDGNKGVIMNYMEEGFVYLDLESGERTVICEDEGVAYSVPSGQGCLIVTVTDIRYFKEGKLQYSRKFAEWGIDIRTRNYYNFVNFSSQGDKALIIFNSIYGEQGILALMDIASGKVDALLQSNDNGITNAATDGRYLLYISNDLIMEDKISKLTLYDTHRKMVIEAEEYYGEQFSNVFIYNGTVAVLGNDRCIVMDQRLKVKNNFGLKSISKGFFLMDDVIYVSDWSGGYYNCEDEWQRYRNLGNSSIDEDIPFFEYANGKFFVCRDGKDYVTLFERNESKYMLPIAEDEVDQFDLSDEYFDECRRIKDEICSLYPEIKASNIFSVSLSDDKKYAIVQHLGDETDFYDCEKKKIVKKLYIIDDYIYNVSYVESTGGYYLQSEDLDIFDKDLKHIVTIPNVTIVGTAKDNGDPVVYDMFSNFYRLSKIPYTDLIKIADDMLGSYEPGEAIRQEYGF